MRIIVCMKQVPDPAAPPSGITVDTEAKRVIMPQGTPPVISPYDENALEAALRIKDAQGATVTVLSAGKNLAKTVLRKSLAAGADELILLEDNAFEINGRLIYSKKSSDRMYLSGIEFVGSDEQVAAFLSKLVIEYNYLRNNIFIRWYNQKPLPISHITA